MTFLWVFLGCGAGGVCRYLVSRVLVLGSFPYATLVANVSGSFLIGLLSVVIASRWSHLSYLKPLLIIGFLGGYTTFSSFSLETLHLIESGDMISALMNMLLSVTLCVFAAWFGVSLAKCVT